MAALILFLAVSASPVGADPVAPWMPLIDAASARYTIPVDWISRVMRAETGGRTSLNGAPIRSPVGAIGLMQLMPATWADMRRLHGFGPDPDDPRDNIAAGTAYLRLLYDRFGYPGLFAAYHAGPARYADYLAGRAPLPAATRTYFASVLRPRLPVSEPRPGLGPPLLFAVRHDGVVVAPAVAPNSEPASLFALEAASR